MAAHAHRRTLATSSVGFVRGIALAVHTSGTGVSPFVVVVFLAVVVHAGVFGSLAAWVAATKGRASGCWFVLGCLFGVFALLAVGFAPAAPDDLVDDETGASDVHPGRPCMSCGTMVSPTAQYCGHCGSDVPPVRRRRAVRTRFGSASVGSGLA
jgi:hypothetical protein